MTFRELLFDFNNFSDAVSLTTDPILPSQIDFISKYVSNIDGLSRKELFAGYNLQTSSKQNDFHQVRTTKHIK